MIDTHPDGLGDPEPLTEPSNRPALGSPNIRFFRAHLEPRGSLHAVRKDRNLSWPDTDGQA